MTKATKIQSLTPAHINVVVDASGGTLTLDSPISLIVAKLQTGATFNCPQCKGAGHDGSGNLCSLCNGRGKTVTKAKVIPTYSL